MSNKKETNENEKEQISWKQTSADVSCRKKGNKIYFFISTKEGKIGFSYHENFMKKVLESKKAS